MKVQKIFGVALILFGIGLLGYWADRSFRHPKTEYHRVLDEQADYGGISALTPNPNKIFLLGGVAALAAGSYMLKK